MDRQKKQSRNGKIISKFIKTFLIAMGIFAGAFAMVVVGFSMFDSSDTIIENPDGTTEVVSGKKGNSIFDIFSQKEDQRDNFLLVGVDEDGTRTDTMMIGTFNHSTVSVDLISVPRDIKVIMPQDRYDVLVAEGKQMNSDRSMKLNEVHHHAGESRGMEYLMLQMEELLDIELDFYVKINTEAFRYIVDEIGGVEFDVPQRMSYYDPTANFRIDLQPGLQTLYGKDAEGLVRYRSYAQADLMRVQVQQQFIKALVSQCLAKDNIMNNAQAMIMATLKYVETDFSITKIPTYIKYLNSFSADNLNTYTMPTLPDNSPSSSGKSYILLDEDGAQELLDVVFRGIQPESAGPSHDKNIQVLNGGYESGLASKGKTVLEQNGYTVISITDYSGTKESYTRIFVNKMGLGDDIQALFNGSKIVYDPAMDPSYDIIVVIGTDGIN